MSSRSWKLSYDLIGARTLSEGFKLLLWVELIDGKTNFGSEDEELSSPDWLKTRLFGMSIVVDSREGGEPLSCESRRLHWLPFRTHRLQTGRLSSHYLGKVRISHGKCGRAECVEMPLEFRVTHLNLSSFTLSAPMSIFLMQVP